MWANLINEGGEGYNPYGDEPRRQQPAWLILSDKIDHIQRVMAGTSIRDPRYEEMSRQLEKLILEKAELKK